MIFRFNFDMYMLKLFIIILLLICTLISLGQDDDPVNKYDPHGLKTGKWVSRWNETGNVSKIENYVAGKRAGLSIYYDLNGRLESEIEYLNDALHGIFKFYSLTGHIEIAEFKNGKQEGITSYYNNKGQLTEEYEYHNNMLNGFHRIYSESGRIIMESTYLNGSEHGTRRSYMDNENRELVVEADFVNDKLLELRHYKKGALIKTVKNDPVAQQERLDKDV